MRDDIIISEKVKGEIEKFSARISQELSKPKQKFIHQMIYGIQASRDIKLSNISRSLGEEIRLIKTENRLSRNAQSKDLTDEFNEVLIKIARRRVKRDTVIGLDITDISKPFAKKMDNLANVWDGSKKRIGNGYWVIEATAADIDKEYIIPLYSELYSQEAEGFKSENEQILRAVKKVKGQIGSRGIWAIDRGADRRILVEKFDELGIRFVIRISGRRNMIDQNKQQKKVVNIAKRIRCRKSYKITIDKEGYKEEVDIRLGKRDKLKLVGVELSLVVVKGFGKDPVLLLTNTEKSTEEVLETYLTRWKCEESFRFLKQEYRLEDIRVRRYTSLRNMVVLLHAVFYFLSVQLGRKLKVNILLKKILEKSKRFFQIPVFQQYAIADGVYRVLFGTKWETKQKIPKKETAQSVFKFAL